MPGAHLSGRAFSDGFDENVGFYRLEYLDRDLVDLGRQFDVIHPLLWMMAGGVGSFPGPISKSTWHVLPVDAHYGVLLQEGKFGRFAERIAARPDLTHVWLVTDSEDAFTEMTTELPRELRISMLYRDYLHNFRINVERSL